MSGTTNPNKRLGDFIQSFDWIKPPSRYIYFWQWRYYYSISHTTMLYTPLLHKAFHFSILVHEVEQKQKRKGKDVAYVTHPIQVGFLLAKAGASDAVIAAGFLHDTLEDSAEETKVTKEELVAEFGQEVADLVDAVTEKNKALPWVKRKALAMKEIASFSHDALLVKSGDVLSNTTELLSDYYEDGDATFKRFNAPKAKLVSHAQEVITTILEAWPKNPLGADLRNCHAALEDIKGMKVTYIYKEPKNEAERINQERMVQHAYSRLFDAILPEIEKKVLSKRQLKEATALMEKGKSAKKRQNDSK